MVPGLKAVPQCGLHQSVKPCSVSLKELERFQILVIPWLGLFLMCLQSKIVQGLMHSVQTRSIRWQSLDGLIDLLLQ